MTKWAIASEDTQCFISTCKAPININDPCISILYTSYFICIDHAETWNLGPIPSQLIEGIKGPLIVTPKGEKSVITITSFGYKYKIPFYGGIPIKTIDLRKVVRNPWRDPTLRKLTGLNESVQQYVEQCLRAKAILKALYKRALNPILKSDTNIAFGCHGGKHRSVAMAELLAKSLKEAGLEVNIIHRDLATKNEE